MHARRTVTLTTATALLGACAVALVSTGWMAGAETGEPSDGCMAFMAPATVPVESEAFVVEAYLSLATGVRTASIEPDSGARIVLVEPLAASLAVHLDTSLARTGGWDVTFVGSGGRCTGRLSFSDTW